jgi:hypothetical protein
VSFWLAACALFMAHSLGMSADEFVFHRRRGLPPWERWGHPLDTLTVLLCYGLALSLPGTPRNLAVYIAAAAFSTLFVTKDEWIHARECGGGEMWLHACLFAFHPVLLGLAGAYMMGRPSTGFASDAAGYRIFGSFLAAQSGLTAVFLAYQLLYWNGPWKSAPERP